MRTSSTPPSERHIRIDLNKSCMVEDQIIENITALSGQLRVSHLPGHTISITIPSSQSQLYREILKIVDVAGCRVEGGRLE